MLETIEVLTIAEIRRQLRHIHIKPISDALGLSIQTIYRIKNGEQITPYHDTIVRLSDYLMKIQDGLERERNV